VPKDITVNLFKDISDLIDDVKTNLAHYANTMLVTLYWRIGQRINQDILKNDRAGYGEKIIKQLSNQLTLQYGSGFDIPNLTRMIRVAKLYPKPQIVATLSQQLSWSHFVKLVSIDDSLKRDFYTEMCCLEKWSVRNLRQKIDGMLFERTALAKKPKLIIEAELKKLKDGDITNPDLYLQDPYVLKFLYPKTISSERHLEDAILSELQIFIQEMGSDFCFVARQKRMSTGKNDRYLDLLFFHRGMKRLIAIDLKLTPFQPEHAGQMEWYLKWLDKHEKRLGEEKPLGIIICSDKDQEDLELLELGKNGIHVSQYLAELPPRKIFEKKLWNVIENAREKYARLAQLSDDNKTEK